MDELEELRNKFKYLAADFSNFKKRSESQLLSIKENVENEMILKFLEIYDDMERLNRQFTDKNLECDIDHFESGFKLIFENFEKILNSFGCFKINCSCGDKFNVKTMEAISTYRNISDETYGNCNVMEIYSHGWTRNGKVIKYTKVVVGI